MSAPATALSRRDDIIRRWRATSGRGRKLRGLVALLRPYRAPRVPDVRRAGARDRPPRWRRRRWPSWRSTTASCPATLTALTLDRASRSSAPRSSTGARPTSQTYLVGWVGQRALQDLRIQLFAHLQTDVGRLLLAPPRRRADLAPLQRRRGARHARLRRHRDAVRLLADADRHRGDPVPARRPARAAHLHRLPDPRRSRSLVFRIVSADAYRATREKVAAITAYLQETLSGIRVVRSFAQEPRHLERFAELNEENRDANMKTVYLNAAYFPGVELLCGARDRRDPALRRHPGRRRATSRSASWSRSWPR